MNKKVYLAPQTAMVRVLTEGTFAGSAEVQNPDDETTGRIEHQEINTGFSDEFTFGDTWS